VVTFRRCSSEPSLANGVYVSRSVGAAAPAGAAQHKAAAAAATKPALRLIILDLLPLPLHDGP
jgi:hypothetical protein